MKKLFSTWKSDLPSGLVVFLVALPLCLGIGLASTSLPGIDGLPSLFAGIIPGVIGGIIVGSLSGSRLGVSGPAAGLITIVTAGILTIGSYEGFLVAVVLSGIFQIIAGYLKAGIIGNYFPSAVIKGMLAAIGITLILKEIPHAVGYDKDFFGDESFWQKDGQNTLSQIPYALKAFQPGAIVVSVISIVVMMVLEMKFFKKFKVFTFLPSALIVVLLGIFLNGLFSISFQDLVISKDHLVSLPVAESLSDFVSFFNTPDFSFLANSDVYVIALTIALVGSLETLLSVEATDKLDPNRHHTPTNRELKAQGVGNIMSGLIGGLPVTQVIVRSSANINTGAKSKLSAIIHGIILFSCVGFIPHLLNLIPFASLAAILFFIGYKLAKIALFKQMWGLGMPQFIPFIGTVLGVLFSDLLTGIGIGMAISILYILKNNYRINFQLFECMEEKGLKVELLLSEQITFLNKGGIAETLVNLKPNSTLIINGSKCREIHIDVIEYIKEFIDFTAKEKNIKVRVIHLPWYDNHVA
ncbi:MAG: MFS superfamily sulfate permease-like transporter [Psychromonas sp.]|jgi:MFS superfamily sulfate permease-like transporter